MQNSRILKTLMVVPFFCSGLSYAELQFKGFASVGAGVFSEDDSSYRGIGDDFEPSVFNKFGLQAVADVNDYVTVTGQFVAKGINDYDMKAEWLYVTIQAPFDTKVRYGKVRAPLFFYSDFLDVGYAYPWITPPTETYRLTDFNNIEALDIVNQHSMGDWTGTIQVYNGLLDNEDSDFILEDFQGINYSLSWEWLTMRASYNTAHYSYVGPALADFTAASQGFAALGAAEAADVYDMSNESADFLGIGATADLTNIFVAFEYTTLAADKQTIVSDDMAYYLTFGYRFGPFMPHVTYSYSENDPDYSFITDLTDPVAIAAVSSLASVVNVQTERAVITAGLRWDFAEGSAFKVELSSVSDESRDINDNILTDVDGTLLSVAVDTVF